MTLTAAGAEAALDSIEEVCSRDLEAQELLEAVGERLGRAAPVSGVFLAATDPETSLCMGAGIVANMPERVCQPIWDHEFLVPDYNKFTDLVDGPARVADLHRATGGRPQRSPRWREFSAITGFEAEVRVAFTAGGRAWGVAQLNRSADLPLFSDAELALLERAAPIVGRGLRAAMLSAPTARAARGPGIVVLDTDGELISLTAEAEAWLREVDTALAARTRAGVPMPIEAYSYAVAARALLAHGRPPPRARLRTRDGVWLMLHASPLLGSDAEGHVALVIEPAKASDVAPIIVEAYGLTPRELDVTRRVARGLKTAEIAAELFLSAHTVRDHLKSIFEKVGVSSRGELVSRLFAEHYYDDVADAIHAAEPRAAALATL